jgi:hypothetical protein
MWCKGCAESLASRSALRYAPRRVLRDTASANRQQYRDKPPFRAGICPLLGTPLLLFYKFVLTGRLGSDSEIPRASNYGASFF